MMNQAPMGYPQEEKEEEKEIDWEDEEGGDAGVAELPQLPVGGPPWQDAIVNTALYINLAIYDGVLWYIT